jgi:hypothetical protein
LTIQRVRVGRFGDFDVDDSAIEREIEARIAPARIARFACCEERDSEAWPPTAEQMSDWQLAISNLL